MSHRLRPQLRPLRRPLRRPVRPSWDDEYEEADAKLSAPVRPAPPSWRRRDFLKAAGAGIGTAVMVPNLLQFQELLAAAPGPLAADEGVVVMILLAGGNDTLNTVIPTYQQTAYEAARPTIAIRSPLALNGNPGVGLNPALPKLRDRYNAGDVALVGSVHYPNPNLSHFESMAYYRSGSRETQLATGWLGRYTDSLAAAQPNALYGVHMGSAVPLDFVGAQTRAIALPRDTYAMFGISTDARLQRVYSAMRRFPQQPSDRGALADLMMRSQVQALDVSAQVQSIYGTALPTGGSLTDDLSLIARLVNLNLGTRVFGATFGGFDTHGTEAQDHPPLMAELDTAIDAFYSQLAPEHQDRVVMCVWSEFSRTVRENGDRGTDHGGAETMIVIGNRVKGGVHGLLPDITRVESSRTNTLSTGVDYRRVWSSLLGWMGADATAVLGGTYAPLDIYDPLSTSTPPTTTPPPPVVSPPAGTVVWSFEDFDGSGVVGTDRSTGNVADGAAALLYGGQPHVWYADRTSGSLRHAWMASSGWRYENLDGTGRLATSSASVSTSVSAITYGSGPHVFHRDVSTNRLRHGWWTGLRWAFEDLDGPGVSGGGRSANPIGADVSALLFGKEPHVFYTDATTGDLRHCWWSGGLARWFFETLDGAGGTDGRVNAAIGADVAAMTWGGSPHVFYPDVTNGRLRHAWWTGSAWGFENLDGSGAGTASGRIDARAGADVTTLEFAGVPHAFYRAEPQTGAVVRHAWWTGATWAFETIAGPSASGPAGTRIAATVIGSLPHVWHHDATAARLRHTWWNGSTWSDESMDGTGVEGGSGRRSASLGQYPTAIATPAGTHVFYADPSTGRLRRAFGAAV